MNDRDLQHLERSFIGWGSAKAMQAHAAPGPDRKLQPMLGDTHINVFSCSMFDTAMVQDEYHANLGLGKACI